MARWNGHRTIVTSCDRSSRAMIDNPEGTFQPLNGRMKQILKETNLGRKQQQDGSRHHVL
jgi:hypothetical protein